MSIYEEIIDWIKTNYTGFDGKWIYFNVIRMENGSASVSSVSGTRIIESYIDGSTKNELVIAIAMVSQYDTEMSETNISAMEEVQSMLDWISSENTLPDLGDGIIVDSFDVIQDIPDVEVDQDAGLCKYQFQCKLNYLQIS